MMCPHCKGNNPRKAVMRIRGDYWCDECAQEVWALMLAGRLALRQTTYWREDLAEAIAALEVKP